LRPPVLIRVKKYNITMRQYQFPKTFKYDNITHLYDIPYNDITLSTQNGTVMLKNKIFTKDNRILNQFVPQENQNLEDHMYKCFTVDMKEIQSKIDTMIVQLKINSWHEETIRVLGFLHTSGSFRSSRRYNIFDENVSNSITRVWVDAVEISNLRSTSKNPCEEKSTDYDDGLVKELLRHSGCKPLFLGNEEYADVPRCQDLIQLSELNENLRVMNLDSRKKFR
jgi:hypothetical protein